MTETETRQFLTKNLARYGYDVQRNESGAVNEGYPDLTISKNNQVLLIELKQGYVVNERLTVAKYQPRQRGKMALVATTQKVRILVSTPNKDAYLLSSPYQKIDINSRAMKWKGTLDKACDLGEYLNSQWGWM